MKEKIEQDMWDQQDQIKETLELIKSGSIKVLDDETINGKSFYVVKVNPDLKKLVEMTLEEQEKSNLYNEDLDFEDIIRKYEATIWVNKDTYVIEKEIINMRMVMTPENIGEESDGLAELDMDMTIEAKMFDFNKAMTIELPTGAEDAMDITELEGLY